MRGHHSSHIGGAASGRTILKAMRHHSHGTKSGEHRYERRKVREYLLYAEVADEAAFDTVR
jgi:hypothetical protein